MFCFLLSYLQVMPSFLDFVLPFADDADPHFTGFSAEESLVESKQSVPKVSQIALSARRMQACYNLWSMEEIPMPKGTRYSIYRTVVYHIFDFNTGKSVWIILSDYSPMKERLSKLAETWAATRFESVVDAFTASLQSHLLLCDLSTRHCQECIGLFEVHFRDFSRNTFPGGADQWPSHSFRSMSQFSQFRTYNQPRVMAHNSSVLHEKYQFSVLEYSQIMEERLHRLLQVLRLNVDVAEELRQYYTSITMNSSIPVEMTSISELYIKKFEVSVRRVEKTSSFSISGLRLFCVHCEIIRHL